MTALHSILVMAFVLWWCAPVRAQWTVLHPPILPVAEWHFVDSTTIRSYHRTDSWGWCRSYSISGMSQDGGRSWTYQNLPVPTCDPVWNPTSFFSKRHGYYQGANTRRPFSSTRILFGTDDAGEQWRPLVRIDTAMGTWMFISDRTGFVTDRYDFNTGFMVGTWMTRDGGHTFSPLSTKSARILAFPEHDHILLAYDSAFQYSDDGGRSFQEIPCPPTRWKTLAHHSDGHVWMWWRISESSSVRLSTSRDFGLSWVTLPDSLYSHPNNRPGLVMFWDSTRGISVLESNIHCTSDGGITWFPTAPLDRNTPERFERIVMACDTSSGRVLLMDRDRGPFWSRNDNPVRFRSSTDFGRTWTTFPSFLPWEVRDVKRWSETEIVALSVPAIEGDRWTAPIDSVAVLVSRDQGASWVETKLRPGIYQDHLTVMKNGRVLVGSSLLSTDYGLTWSSTDLPHGLHPTAIPLFTTEGLGVTVAQQDSLHLRVLRSQDWGTTWQASSILRLPYPGTGFAIRVKELLSGVWHLTYKYSKYQGDRGAVVRFLSTDAGNTWGNPRVISPQEYDYAWMEPQTRDGARYLVATELYGLWYLFRSLDSGATYHQTMFTPQYSPPPGERYSWNGRDYGWISDSLCYAVSTEGYCVSRNGGGTWFPEDGHVVDGVRRLIVGDSTEQWFVGLNGLILQHRGPLGVLTSHESPPAAPRDLAVPITYPNPVPASGQAQVEFTLARETTVGVYVHDILGRRQRLLHEGRLTSGPHRLSLRPSDLAPGLYFITVSTPEGVKVGKMLVMGRE